MILNFSPPVGGIWDQIFKTWKNTVYGHFFPIECHGALQPLFTCNTMRNIRVLKSLYSSLITGCSCATRSVSSGESAPWIKGPDLGQGR